MNLVRCKKHLFRQMGAILIGCIGVIFSLSLVFQVQAGENEKVRVGFFAFDGYHMTDSHGNRSGYGYDFLQYLARYTNFEYEYVGYEKSWGEMQEMLEAGEIDLLTSAQKSEERLSRFDFSDQPIGNSSVILTVKAGDNRYMVDDYAKLDGIRIGLLEGNSRNSNLEQFAQDNNFTYQPVYYGDSSELSEALQAGDEVDAILTSNLRKIQNEWIVATFDTAPFYIMVRKGDQELLEQINEGVEKLNADYQDLPSTLYTRYYTPDNGDAIAYTAEERDFIENWQESGESLRVTVNSGREPVSYFDSGRAQGIIPEMAKEILRRTGIPYKFIPTAPAEDARKLLEEQKTDIRFDGSADFNGAENYGFRVTDPYLELPLSCVTLKKFSGKPASVAVMANSDVVEEYVKSVYEEASIVRYSSTDECIKAVLDGEQDAAFFQTYIAQRFVNSDIKNRLKEQLIPGYGMRFAVSVRQDDALLFSIIDKAVTSMDSEEKNRIVLEQTSHIAREMSLMAYLYENPVFFLCLLFVSAGFVIVLTLYIFRRKTIRLEREKSHEFERFITYVCKANNSVIEYQPGSRLARSYQVADGKIQCTEYVFGDGREPKYSIHPEDIERVERVTSKEAIADLMETGGVLYYECRVRINEIGDTYQWFAYTIQGGLKGEEGPGSVVIFMKNIDRAKREEEERRLALQDALATARQASEAKGTFMSRMSHEIRTPLNAIIGYMTIAKTNLENLDRAEECLSKSEYAAHHLLNIINDVLDISAIESGKMKIACEAFNIRELISGITAIFRAQAAQKGVGFHVRISGLTEEDLLGDQLRVSQILMNLLSNAVKFTSSGGHVTLTILQKAIVSRKLYLQLEVADTGNGMTEDYKKRLFQPFEQQDAATAQKYGGTGLGLSITKNLVTMMNGTIDVKSELGKGTVFTVNLSFGIAEGQTQERMWNYDFSGLRVLVRYDENSDYKYIQALLERFDVSYDLAFCQAEAMERIGRKEKTGETYNLFLIDWDMADSQAEEAARQIRAAAPGGAPLLAVAYESPDLSGSEEVADGIILKPVFQSSLFDALSNITAYHTGKRSQVGERADFGLTGVRILMAEDNPLNMEIAKELLKEHGLVVDGAENGQKALEMFEQSREGTYQAILMDIQMPVMNGYEAAARIRGCAHPQAKEIPVIAITADAFAEDINRALAAGMNSHVSKPIDFDGLCKILSELL